MANLTGALMIVLALNLVFMVTQEAILEVNPPTAGNNPVTMFNCTTSTFGYLSNDCTQGPNDARDYLPGATSDATETINPQGVGTLFTDIFNTIRGWFNAPFELIGYVYNLVTAPTNLIKLAGFPSVIVNAFGLLWYGGTFFLLAAFLIGRQGE